MNRRLFLTGGTGLVGGGILRHFIPEGWDVVMGTSSSGLVSETANLRLVPFTLARPDTPDVRAALAGCSAVIHASAVLPRDGRAPDDVMSLNTMGTWGLLQAAAASGVPQAILIGRVANHIDPALPEIHEDHPARPGDPYGVSKQVSECVGAYFDRIGLLRVATLRISAPYGPDCRARAVIPAYVERALAGEDLEVWGSGERSQTFTHVTDIARACALAIAHSASGPYNIAGPESVSTRALADAVLRAVGETRSRVVFVDRADPGEATRIRVSTEKAKADFGYQPAFDLDAGLRDLVGALRGGRPRLWRVRNPQPVNVA